MVAVLEIYCQCRLRTWLSIPQTLYMDCETRFGINLTGCTLPNVEYFNHRDSCMSGWMNVVPLVQETIFKANKKYFSFPVATN